MKRISSRRASPALVIACIALFVSMGGVSYAVSAGSIDSRAVKDGSIRNKDFQDGALRGQEAKRDGFGGGAIKESALGKVPSADTVDGKNAAGLVTRWALVNENGDIEEQSGGFTVVSKPGINGQPAGNPNIYISAGSSLVGKGLNVSTAIQNRIDRSGDATADPAFNGDTAVGRCNTAAINCVPAGTNADNVLVVRSLVDNTDAASQTRRFYVEVTE